MSYKAQHGISPERCAMYVIHHWQVFENGTVGYLSQSTAASLPLGVHELHPMFTFPWRSSARFHSREQTAFRSSCISRSRIGTHLGTEGKISFLFQARLYLPEEYISWPNGRQWRLTINETDDRQPIYCRRSFESGGKWL